MELLYFSDGGVWDEEATCVPLAYVQCVDFDVRYVNTLARYLPAARAEGSER